MMPSTLFRRWEHVFSSFAPDFAQQPGYRLLNPLQADDQHTTLLGNDVATIANTIFFEPDVYNATEKRRTYFQGIFVLSALFVMDKEDRIKTCAPFIRVILKNENLYALQATSALIESIRAQFFPKDRPSTLYKFLPRITEHEQFLHHTLLEELPDPKEQKLPQNNSYNVPISAGLLHDIEIYDEDQFGWLDAALPLQPKEETYNAHKAICWQKLKEEKRTLSIDYENAYQSGFFKMPFFRIHIHDHAPPDIYLQNSNVPFFTEQTPSTYNPDPTIRKDEKVDHEWLIGE